MGSEKTHVMETIRSKLWVHLVLIPANTLKPLKAHDNILLDQDIRMASLKYGMVTEAVHILPGHMHILIQLPFYKSLPEAVRWLKLTATRWLKSNGFTYNGFSWQKGFSAFSVSASQLQAVRKYIKTQPLLHMRRSFDEEMEVWIRRYDLIA